VIYSRSCLQKSHLFRTLLPDFADNLWRNVQANWIRWSNNHQHATVCYMPYYIKRLLSSLFPWSTRAVRIVATNAGMYAMFTTYPTRRVIRILFPGWDRGGRDVEGVELWMCGRVFPPRNFWFFSVELLHFGACSCSVEQSVSLQYNQCFVHKYKC